MDIRERRAYLEGDAGVFEQYKYEEKVERDRVSVIEVWCEVLDGDPKNLNGLVSREINALLERIPGWERSNKVLTCGKLYGKQRVFVRCETGNKNQESMQPNMETGNKNQ